MSNGAEEALKQCVEQTLEYLEKVPAGCYVSPNTSAHIIDSLLYRIQLVFPLWKKDS